MGAAASGSLGEEHPFHHAGHGHVLDAQLAEHVEALGAVVHGVCGDVGEDAARGESVLLAAPLAGDDGVEGSAEGGLLEVVAGGVVQFADFGQGVLLLFEAWAGLGLVEDVGPAAHGAEVVQEVVVDRAGAHEEDLVELLVAEGGAGVVELRVGPAVVGEEDGVGVGGGGGHVGLLIHSFYAILLRF